MFDAYFNNEDDFMDENKIKFPCPRTGDNTTTGECSSCINCDRCDIYATMLDEVHDLIR